MLSESDIATVAQLLYRNVADNIGSYDHGRARLDLVEEPARVVVESAIINLADKDYVALRNAGIATGLLLLGDFGVGKTSILYLIALEYKRRTINQLLPQIDPQGRATPDAFAENLIGQAWAHQIAPVRIMTHAELIESLRNKENPDRVLTSPVPLFIDDFGRGYSDKAGWNLTLQYELFDFRWRNRYPTFVTSNYDSEDFKNLGFEWGATVDRLADSSWLKAWTITGESRRRNR